MKRVLMLILSVILLMATLTGCIMIPLYKNFKIDASIVESIDFYDLRQAESSYSDFSLTEKPVYTITTDDISAFLDDLAKIQFSDTIYISIAAFDPSFSYGDWTVRIFYKDNSYAFLSYSHYGESFDKDGNLISSHHFGCDQEEWLALIGKYVPEIIFNQSQSSNE